MAEFLHKPVLYGEVVENLDIRPDGVYVDGTLGGGGHSRGICERLSEKGVLIGIDRDYDALEAAEKNLQEFSCQKIFVHSNYSDIKRVLKGYNIIQIDGAILDLGVSSYQLDTKERGFSYMQSAPLDMRMDAGASFSAFDVVNTYTKDELCAVIRDYGEERWASRISEFIVRERAKKAVETTDQLVEIIKAAIPASARRSGPHPAKRTFQAIRIEVNDELDGLKKAVGDFVDVLAKDGRLCIITFHSLEDRIVKQEFQRMENPCVCPPGLPCVCGKKPAVRRIHRKPILPSEEERKENPRSRSAKLRVIRKI